MGSTLFIDKSRFYNISSPYIKLDASNLVERNQNPRLHDDRIWSFILRRTLIVYTILH
jgi:hypothetical protein